VILLRDIFTLKDYFSLQISIILFNFKAISETSLRFDVELLLNPPFPPLSFGVLEAPLQFSVLG